MSDQQPEPVAGPPRSKMLAMAVAVFKALVVVAVALAMVLCLAFADRRDKAEKELQRQRVHDCTLHCAKYGQTEAVLDGACYCKAIMEPQ